MLSHWIHKWSNWAKVAYDPACKNCHHLITGLCYLNTLILRLFEHFEHWFHLTENDFAPLEVQMG